MLFLLHFSKQKGNYEQIFKISLKRIGTEMRRVEKQIKDHLIQLNLFKLEEPGEMNGLKSKPKQSLNY